MSASPAQFPSAHGALVPRDPADPPDRLIQERQEEQINAPRLLKYINKTLDAIAQLEPNENLKIHNMMTKCVAYYDGRWDGYLRNGEWVDNRVVGGEILPSDNEYKKQIDKLQMEMCRSRIGYDATAVNKFSAHRREAAQFAQRRIEVNQERIETDPFIEAENMSLLLKTIALRYTFFDRNADSQEKSVEMNVMKNITQGSKMAVCRTCGLTAGGTNSLPMATGYEAMKATCPNCGDTETREIEAPDSEGIETQQQKKSAGRVVTVRPDATMVQMDLNARDIQSTSFIRWRLVLRRCDWESMFPNTRISSSDESTESRHRSQSQNQSSNVGESDAWTSDSGVGGGDQFEKIEGELVWLDAKVYQRYRNKENETLGDGRNLPAGAELPFPQGCCVARIKQKILDIYPSNKNRCWTLCVYGLREHALHGSGTLAMLGPQDIINESNAKILANQTYAAAGREFIRAEAEIQGIQGGQLPSYDKIGVIGGCPPERDLVDWAYGRSQPSNLASDVYAFRTSMQGSLQDAAGTSSLSMQGAADVKQLGTATGVEASRDQAVGRMIPNRKLQAFMGAEWATQVLELERENYTADTFLEMAGKSDEKGEVEYTERGVKAFFEMDVRTELTINPKPGSWMPTTPAQDRANATDFASVVAQIGASPQIVSLLAPNYGIDYSVDEWGAAQRNASMRLEEYARVSEVITQGGHPPSPEMVQVVLSNCAGWARINPTMDKHEAFRNFYEDWWVSDEGRNADPLLRLVVQEVHDSHLNKGIVKQGQDQSAAAIAVKAPEMDAMEQQANQQKQQQDAAAAQAEQQGKQDQVEAAIGEQALAERDREHAAQVKASETEQKAGIDAAHTEHQAVVNAAVQNRQGDEAKQ